MTDKIVVVISVSAAGVRDLVTNPNGTTFSGGVDQAVKLAESCRASQRDHNFYILGGVFTKISQARAYVTAVNGGMDVAKAIRQVMAA